MRRWVGVVALQILVFGWCSAPPASAAPAHTGGDDQLRSRATAPLPPVMGRSSVLVIPVYWKSPDTLTPEELGRRVLGDVDAWYQLSSYGRAGLKGDVVPEWLRIDGADDGGDCWRVGADEIQRQARVAALEAGFDAARYRHTIVYFPRDNCADDQPSAWALGLGADVWLDGFSDVGNIVHELGHNYGLPHSLRAVCTDPSTQDLITLADPEDCALPENVHDVMGATGSPWSFSAPVKDRLGWLEGRKTRIAPGQTVTITPLEDPSHADAAYLTTASGRRYWFEYRQRLSMDNDLPAAATEGVLVNMVDDGWSNGDPVLLDMHPETADDLYDARLGGGESWTSPEGYTVRVKSLGPDGARVGVTAPLPARPRIGRASSGTSADRIVSVRARWARPSDTAPVARYRVTATDVRTRRHRTVVVAGVETSTTIDGLRKHHRYVLTVRAENQYGHGPTSKRSNRVTAR